MKPFKAGHFFAIWLLRIALIASLFTIYYNSLTTLNFTNIAFYISTIMLFSGLFIILGGILSKPGMTIIAGLIISFISIYKIIISFNGVIDNFLISHLIPLAVGFYFFTHGNNE